MAVGEVRGGVCEHPILGDPYFLPVDIDVEDARMVFVRGSAMAFRGRLRLSAIDFPLEALVAIPIRRVLAHVALLPRGARTHFLFHLPFTGSTFLTRLLEGPTMNLLRDPACLDAVFQGELRLRSGETTDEIRAAVLALLDRPVAGAATVVRTAGYHPEMVGPLARASTCRGALFLYSEPEDFLLQVLKSGRRRSDLRHLVVNLAYTPAEREGLAKLLDVEVAVRFWAQMVRAVLDTEGALVRALSCDELFACPTEVAARVATWLGISPATLAADASATLGTHAKDGHPFNAEQRARSLADGLVRHAEELRAARSLLESVGAPALLARLRERRLP